jgi:hypothetical protein
MTTLALRTIGIKDYAVIDDGHRVGRIRYDAPPRRGTPEYDAWMAKRAEEAARPKTEQQQQPK